MSAPESTPATWTARVLDAEAGTGRVTLLTAQTGRYTLDIHDATGSNGSIHIVMWSVTDRGQRLAEGVAGSSEAAKVAAEQEARRLAFSGQSSVAQPGGSVEVVTDPALVAYLEWADATTAHDRLSDEHDEMAARLGAKHPDSIAKFEEYSEALEKRDRADQALNKAVPSTPIGVLARFAHFTHRSASCMYESDIRLWQGVVGDIARLGLLPLPGDIAAFGEGRYFGALHRAAMSTEGIDPSGHSITLPSSVWEPTIEQAGIIYPLPVGVAELMVAEERRNRFTNVEKATANPDEAKALDERALTIFRQVPDERKAMMLRWLEFGVTGSHLHAASLRFAQENDLLDEYRDRLIGQLQEVADAQFSADLNDISGPVRSALVGLIKAAARGEGLDETVEAFRRVEREEGETPGSTEKAVAFATDMHRRRHGNLDADLLAAFDRWVPLTRQMDAPDADEATSNAAYEKAREFSERLETIKPKTLEGVAVVLRYLFAKRGENPEHYEPILAGTAPNEAALFDYRDRLLWNTIQAVEEMGARSKGRASA